MLRIVMLWCLLCVSVYAEVVTDGSLGPRVSLNGPEYLIDAELGERHERNLFHSFSRLNLGAKESAVFSGPEGIRHIIGRVTNGRPSQINGVLRSDIANSQLWLINPMGIGIGRLDAHQVPGGVSANAASALHLKDGGIFYADPTKQSVLTIASPQQFDLSDSIELPAFPPGSMAQKPRGPKKRNGAPPPPRAYVNKRRRTRFEPQTCAKQVYEDLSHFRVSHYRGSPLSPDDWQPSRLLPMAFESASKGDKK
ncbi:MAG: filamentous hemagglutinin N-terminal domain-containing protein [Gammaproteobacteria bacterium]|nr:filamentous hemagglutinin N-terminal domain-containing protein [Gammaproteobacteria bacterium]